MTRYFRYLGLAVLVALCVGLVPAQQPAPQPRYLVFATALGRTNTGVGNLPAVASIGHLELQDGGKVAGAYWETHNWSDHKQLTTTGLKGPLGPVLRANPSRITYTPAYSMSWKANGTGYDVSIGSIVYHWKPSQDPDDPDRLECSNFYPNQWSRGFAYFSTALVGPAVTFDQTSQDPNSIAYDYAGMQLVSSAGTWNPTPTPAGISTYFFDNASKQVLRYGLVDPADGSGLKVGEQIGLNWSKHSSLWFCTYGGHDFNRDGVLNLADGGHACTGVLVKRAATGQYDRCLYVENSYQTDPNVGNIVAVAYLTGLYLPPGYNDFPAN